LESVKPRAAAVVRFGERGGEKDRRWRSEDGGLRTRTAGKRKKTNRGGGAAGKRSCQMLWK